MKYNTLVEYALSAIVCKMPRDELCDLLTTQDFADIVTKVDRFTLGEIINMSYNERLRFSIPSSNLLDILYLTDPRVDIDYSWIASMRTCVGSSGVSGNTTNILTNLIKVIELADIDKLPKTSVNIVVNQPRPTSGNRYIMLYTWISNMSAIRGIENRSFGVRFIIDTPIITQQWLSRVGKLYCGYLLKLLGEMLPIDENTERVLVEMLDGLADVDPPKVVGVLIYDNSIRFTYSFGTVE
jgi:hypothetical protein